MAAHFLSDQTAPNFDDPLGMLTACHGRIGRQLETLARLQRHLPENGCDHDARVAARGILKYFDTAAPNHHADEEASLFPRLARALPDGIGTLLADLERDHATLAVNWRKLRPLLAAIAGGQRANLPPGQVATGHGRLRSAHRPRRAGPDPARRADVRRGDDRGNRQRNGAATRRRSRAARDARGLANPVR